MATSVFTPCAGVVAYKRKDCDGSPQFLDISVGGTKLYEKGLITGVSAALTGNYQFLHTVNNFIYLYAFGDRISTINISGLGFIKTCPGSDNAQIQKIYDFYKTNRVARRMSPLNIVISGDGGSSFKFIGYLTGMNIDAKNAEALGTVGYWTMRFEAVIDE